MVHQGRAGQMFSSSAGEAEVTLLRDKRGGEGMVVAGAAETYAMVVIMMVKERSIVAV